MKAIFRLLETFFGGSFVSTSGNITEISGNSFFGGKTLFPLAERNFLSSENVFLLFRASFLQVKTVTETS